MNESLALFFAKVSGTFRDMRKRRFNARETATLIQCGYRVDGSKEYAERDGNIIYPKK